jgi:hypothetical protein
MIMAAVPDQRLQQAYAALQAMQRTNGATG